jgi:hypothetical protein
MRAWLKPRKWKSTTGTIFEDKEVKIWRYKSAFPAQQASVDQISASSYCYRYEVSSHTYFTNCYTFGEDPISEEHFRIGQVVKVFYDPQNPEVAVLNRTIPAGVLVGTLLVVSSPIAWLFTKSS